MLETIVCMIQPPPFLYYTWVKGGVIVPCRCQVVVDTMLVFAERGGVVTHYGTDDLLTVLMIPRVYLVFRVFRDSYGMNHENNRHVGCDGRV
jgi:hypothetical protein